MINRAAADRFERAADSVRQQGRFAAGGEILTGGVYDKGYYVAPSIAADLPADHDLHKEELFLPLLTVRRFGDLAAAIRDGNDVRYGLTAGIYTRDEGELRQFLDTAEAGVLYANRASGRDHRRLARHPDLLRLERLRRHRQGRPRPLVRAAVHARAEPHGDGLEAARLDLFLRER